MQEYLHYTEKELLSLLAQGDEIAFTKLFYSYKDKLYSFLIHVTGSPDAAQDVLQDVFLKVWKDRQVFVGVDNLNAYLFRMAQNHAINGLRRQSRTALILTEIAREERADHTAETILSGKEVQALLQQAVGRLTPQQRQVFELSRNQGLKYEEIAAQLNISVSTVRNHMVQALKQIREYILAAYPIGAVYCALLLIPLA